MSRGVNKCILVGRLGKDPETRYTASGTAVTNFSLATSEEWKDKNSGEKQEKTEWHNIVTFGKLAEICGEYLKKGSECYVEGSLTTEKWTDKSGNDRYTTKIKCNEMQMLGGKSESQAGQANQNQQQGQGAYANSPASQAAIDAGNGGGNAFDDDIPFAPLSEYG